MATMELARIKTEGPEAAQELLQPLLFCKRQVAFQGKLSLEALATKTIIEYEGWALSGQNENPFDSLPTGVVRQLLAAFLTDCATSEDLRPSQLRLVEMLMRAGRIREVDLTPWSDDNLTRLEHLVVAHCPELKTYITIFKAPFMYYLAPETTRSVDSAMCRLRQIRDIRLANIQMDFYAVQAVAINCNQLAFLELTLEVNDFRRLGAPQLELLTNLQELHLNLNTRWVYTQNARYRLERELVGMVLLLPSLKVLGCWIDNLSLYWDSFVFHYGQRAGGRSLTIHRMEIGAVERAECNFWPPKLKIRSILFEGPFSTEDMDLFCTINAEALRALRFEHCRPSSCLRLMKALGANLSHLQLDIWTPFIPDIDDVAGAVEHLDLQQLVMNTQNVVNCALMVDYDYYHAMERNPSIVIQSSHFRRWTRFKLSSDDIFPEDPGVDDPAGTNILSKLFQLYLEGAEELDTLDIWLPGTLRVALATLKSNPRIGERTRRLFVRIQPQYDREELLGIAVDLAALLILRSPFLEEVVLHGREIETLQLGNFNWFMNILETAQVKFTVAARAADVLAEENGLGYYYIGSQKL